MISSRLVFTLHKRHGNTSKSRETKKPDLRLGKAVAAGIVNKVWNSPVLSGLALTFVAIIFALISSAGAFAAPYAAMVMDARTGEVIHSRNADTRLHPASLTKMMTLYIAFQAVENGEISLDDKVKISRNAAAEPPSKLGLRAGQKIELRYLIRAAAVKSANDAATAIGEAISGSETAFAQRMTRTARQLGMSKTTFKNAHGLTASGHLSTARDMTTLGRHLFYDYPDYYNLFSRKTTSAKIKSVNNTNRRLLSSYRGADGIKTGYTRAAGYNLVASARRGQERIIATVFGGRSTVTRNAKVAELLNLGFSKAPSKARVRKPAKPAYLANSDIPGAASGVSVRANGLVAVSLRPKLRPGRFNAGEDGADPEVAQLVARLDTSAESGLLGSGGVNSSIETAVADVLRETSDPIAPVVRPKRKPEPIAAIEEVSISRPPGADKRKWAISIGLFHTEYKAEKELLRTALSEVETLKESRRIVVRTKRGFDANFQGLTWDNAMQACERLKARSLECSMVSG